jgi:hypothetical protein
LLGLGKEVSGSFTEQQFAGAESGSGIGKKET